MSNEGISSLAIIGQNMIKYDRLNDLTNASFAGSNSNVVTIGIDLSSMLLPIFGDAFNPAAMTHEYEIAAGIINLITHYRTFYWKACNVEATFHLVWSSNCPEMCRLYNNEYNGKYLAVTKYSPIKIEIILKNIEMLANVCQFLPNVSITTGTFETGVILGNILSHSDTPNIIITKDIMTMQAACHIPETVIFRPKKSNGVDSSFNIIPNGMGIYDYLCDLRNNTRPELLHAINPSLIGMVLAMTRVPERNVKSIVTTPNILSAIDTAIAKGSLLNEYNSNAIIVSSTLDPKVSSRLITNGINERFKSVDYRYQLHCYRNNPERVNFVGCLNKFDPQTLHDIIDRYFKGIEVKL